MTRKDTIANGPFGLACPSCGAGIAFLAFVALPSHSTDKIHICPSCRTALTLESTRMQTMLIAFLVSAPIFLLTSTVGFHVMTEIPQLSFFHEHRGHREPTFTGFLIALVILTLPVTTFTTILAQRIFGTLKKAPV